MQNINPDQHLGKTGLFIKKMSSNELIVKEVKLHTDKMMNLFRAKVFNDVKLPDEKFDTLKNYLQAHTVALVSELLRKDFPEYVKTTQTALPEKINAIQPKEDKDLPQPRKYNIDVHQKRKILINKCVCS